MPSIGKSGSSKIPSSNSKNVIKKENLGTVESQHKKKIDVLNKRKKDLPALKRKLITLNKKLKTTNNPDSKNDIINQINNINEDILKIQNNGELFDYYMNVGPLLFKYFDERNNIGNCSNNPRNTSKVRRKGGITDFLNKSRIDKELDNEIKQSNKGITGPGDMISDNLKTNMTPFQMLDDYLSKTDPNWVKKTNDDKAFIGNEEAEHFCEDCKCIKILLHKESKVVCPKCGIQDTVIIESDIPSYKDPPPEMNYFEYKRINHFNELLVQFQAKESTHIPKEVYDMIRKELKKERKSVNDLNFSRVKRYLKKYSHLGYNHYYDHTFHIINKMNGQKPLSMTPEMEEKLRYLFLQIQKPFDKYCPTGRKNFISYNFVFYKFCEMLGYDEFLKYFPLLKSKEKLYQQEQIWKKICDDIGF
jgi:hypothetical protein